MPTQTTHDPVSTAPAAGLCTPEACEAPLVGQQGLQHLQAEEEPCQGELPGDQSVLEGEGGRMGERSSLHYPAQALCG